MLWSNLSAQMNGTSSDNVGESLTQEANRIASNFTTIYAETKCGLNYVHQEVILNERRGGFNIAQSQPASIVIAGLPTTAVIESAFLYYTIEGVDRNTQDYSFNITNPDGLISNYTTNAIAFGPSACWGTTGSATYRNDVTSAISGDGTYSLLGLPTFIIPGDSPDTNGASLFIIYSDSAANYSGTLIIEDGHEVSIVNSMNINCEISGFTVPNSITNSTGFLLLSDDQDFDPTIVTINGATVPFTDNDALVMVEGPIGLVPSQIISAHEVNRIGEDCVSVAMTGVYFQDMEFDCQSMATIPTTGQWGLIILAILLLTVGVVRVRSSQINWVKSITSC